MRIMLDTSLGIYCKVQTRLSIVSLKRLRIIGTQEQNSCQENSFAMLPRSTITWYQKKLTNTDPKDSKILVITTCFSRLEKKTSVLATV